MVKGETCRRSILSRGVRSNGSVHISASRDDAIAQLYGIREKFRCFKE
jgi:hypothetical protein